MRERGIIMEVNLDLETVNCMSYTKTWKKYECLIVALIVDYFLTNMEVRTILIQHFYHEVNNSLIPLNCL